VDGSITRGNAETGIDGTVTLMSAKKDQVLEFELGGETYCVSIAYVTEIVDVGDLTTVPNSPPHVRGVMDLRGRTTSIIDPKVVFDIEEEGQQKRIVVFDPEIIDDQSAAGWLVDEVHQVVQIGDTDVDEEAAEDDDTIVGVVKRDGDFVIWVDPAAIHAE
jgi:purine-binding chemotaxis protein CheW